MRTARRSLLPYLAAATALIAPLAFGGHSAHTIAQRIAAALAPDRPIPNFG